MPRIHSFSHRRDSSPVLPPKPSSAGDALPGCCCPGLGGTWAARQRQLPKTRQDG